MLVCRLNRRRHLPPQYMASIFRAGIPMLKWKQLVTVEITS